jgi:hypothetical protein
MITETGPVIIITGESPSHPGIHAVVVRHRTLSQVCGEGATVQEAVEDLVRQLIRESSSVSGWHLAELEQVIADVRAYLDPRAEPPHSVIRHAVTSQ